MLPDRMAALCVFVRPVYLWCFCLFCTCSNAGERGGPGEVPNTALGVSLQGDRTAWDRQDGLSPGLCGPQHWGMDRTIC